MRPVLIKYITLQVGIIACVVLSLFVTSSIFSVLSNVW